MVRVALEEKQLEWTSRPIRLSDFARSGNNLTRTAAYWRRLQDRPAYQRAIVEWHEPH